MTATDGDSDDKVVVDPVEIEVGVRATGSREQRPLARETEPMAAQARGTQQLHFDPDIAIARGRDTRELDRDPVEVLRMWPHTAGVLEGGAVSTRARLPGPSANRRFEDKIALAHLALDLYRELEEHQASARGAAPVPRVASEVCDNQCCTTRTNVLRGALVEACLLVQRVALVTPEPIAADEVEDRLRDLLALIDH